MPPLRVLLVQLPIPAAGLEPVRGNVPLAAGYLTLFARRSGLAENCTIDIFPAALANGLGDQGLVEAILARQPQVVGFTCYLWNIDRSLWIAADLKKRRPEVQIIVGGPEVTADNQPVLEHPAVDFAAIGEGEQTFAEFLQMLAESPGTPTPIAGLYRRGGPLPAVRAPLAELDRISSPYVEGILDAAEEKTLLLETARGCVFKCRFCYYPKSYDRLYRLSSEAVRAVLQHAQKKGVREVFLLDPTLNQRRDFADLVQLLREGNPERQFTYSAELRAEGITPTLARAMREANFAEVEVGLQSVGETAQELMDRRVNRKAFARGVQALLDEGIRVRTDLILGLPGDTAESIREGIEFLHGFRPQCEIQAFNLSILPGTAFRQDAERLGLRYQARPPYYVLQTPTLATEDLIDLAAEAQEVFETEFDPVALPEVVRGPGGKTLSGIDPARILKFDLDKATPVLPPESERPSAVVLWLKAVDLRPHGAVAESLIRQLLTANPHSTLEVLLEAAWPERLDRGFLEPLLAACYQTTTYLDRYYSLHPSRLAGGKRLMVLVEEDALSRLPDEWLDEIESGATIVTHDENLGTPKE